MKITNRYSLPQPIVDAIRNDPYNANADISCTTLSKPPRMRVLERRHWEKIEVDAMDRMRLLIGKLVHGVLEQGQAAGHIKEQRLYARVRGWTVSGAYDLLRLDGGKLIDYKTTLAFSYMMGEKPEWTAQLNTLAWLLANGTDKDGNRVCYSVEELEIVPIILDWTKHKARKDPRFPQVAVPVVPIELWPAPRTEAWINERVRLHQEAEAMSDEALPHCTKEERWAKDPVFAVKKEGAKKAERGGLHDTREAAEAFLAGRPGFLIEERAGEQTRCEDYCLVKKFCSQYRATVPLGAEGMAI